MRADTAIQAATPIQLMQHKAYKERRARLCGNAQPEEVEPTVAIVSEPPPTPSLLYEINQARAKLRADFAQLDNVRFSIAAERRQLATEREQVQDDIANLNKLLNQYNKLSEDNKVLLADVPGRLSRDRIASVVCLHYRVSLKLMRGACREPWIVKARHVLVHLIEHFNGPNAMGIGRYLHKDHTSIIHARRKIEKQLLTDGALNVEIAKLKEFILNLDKIKTEEKNESKEIKA